METPSDDQFLHINGFLHEIDFAPAGDPWPFVLTSSTGITSTSVQVQEEDAEQIVEFLTRHLPKQEVSHAGAEDA